MLTALLRSGFRVLTLALASTLFSHVGFAQPADEKGASDPAADPPEEEEKAEPKSADKPPEAAPSASVDVAAKASASPAAESSVVARGTPPESVEVAPGAPRCHDEPIHPGDYPGARDHSCFLHTLSWDGGFLTGSMELDVGYAKYEYPELKTSPSEELYDLRGRFVFGPVFNHPFGGGYFLSATGQVVAWVREQERLYQVNVDDVWAQVGHEGDWDFQLGRFMTWRVYHKGLGFDLYTLEDNGPSLEYPIANANYAVHTYEVDYIFLRNARYVGGEIAGRAAAHYYPARFLGFELAGAYGAAEAGGSNTLGGRFAGDFHYRFIRASVGAEYRYQKPTAKRFTASNPGTPDETYIECKDCGVSDNKGVGGGLVLKYSPVEVGGGVAKGFDTAHLLAAGPTGGSDRDITRTGSRMSYGGYVELDPGRLVFHRSLILGVGYQHTEWILDNHNQQFHTQGAAYIAFPLGFNDAMLKLVLSRATAERFDATNPDGTDFIQYDRKMTAARLRMSMLF